MTDKYVNAIGEHIEIREDGTRHRVHHEHPLAAKIAKGEDERKRRHHEQHQARMRRIEIKKNHQKRNGFPSDKSPI